MTTDTRRTSISQAYPFEVELRCNALVIRITLGEIVDHRPPSAKARTWCSKMCTPPTPLRSHSWKNAQNLFPHFKEGLMKVCWTDVGPSYAARVSANEAGPATEAAWLPDGDPTDSVGCPAGAEEATSYALPFFGLGGTVCDGSSSSPLCCLRPHLALTSMAGIY